MNEIIENTFIFIDDLEKSDLIKELTECKEILLKDFVGNIELKS